MSEFAAFATKLLRIPSHKICIHYSINPNKNIHSIQSEKGFYCLLRVDSLYAAMLGYKRVIFKLNLPIIHRFQTTLLSGARRRAPWLRRMRYVTALALVGGVHRFLPRFVVQVDRSEIMLGVLIQLFSDGEQLGSGSCLFRARNRWAREPL